MAKPSKRARLAAIPTSDEQLQLQQTQQLVKSNLLALQLGELLVEVGAESIYAKKRVQDWIHTFKTSLLSELSGQSLGDISLEQRRYDGILIHPFMQISNTTTLKSLKVTNIEVIGSFDHQTSTFPFLNIDVAVTMAPDSFEAR